MDAYEIRGLPGGPITVGHAIRFVDRLRGWKAKGGLDAVLIDTSSVHTFGLGGPIAGVALDECLRVVRTRVMTGNRVFWFRGAAHILELPADRELPVVGSSIELTDD